jgi:hypothetical protein
MTRLDALRALLKKPTGDGYDHLRSHTVAIKTKPKRKKAVKSSPISWLRGVHGKGA